MLYTINEQLTLSQDLFNNILFMTTIILILFIIYYLFEKNHQKKINKAVLDVLQGASIDIMNLYEEINK